MTRWEQKRKTMERRIEQVKDFAESVGLPRNAINCWHNCAISTSGVGWAAEVDPKLAQKALDQFHRVINGKAPRL